MGITIAASLAGKPEKTGEKQAPSNTGGKFQKGQSGNLPGRPKGARNKATVAAEALLGGQAKAITAKCIELALAGNIVAIKICLDRICPPRKSRQIAVNLPTIETLADVVTAGNVLLEEIRKGALSLDEVSAYSTFIASQINIVEAGNLERRIRFLEGRI